MIKRSIQKHIEQVLFQQKAIIIYGARQVGKTTLIQQIAHNYGKQYLYLNCDEPDVKDSLTKKSSTELKRFIGNYSLVLIDEAQRVENIGLTIKLLVDNYPNIQLLVTGSSSFELSNKIVEPLTGRKYEYHLYPFSYEELAGYFTQLELKRILPDLMIMGMYPDVVLNAAQSNTILDEITRSYLYKDILAFPDIRNSDALDKLLKALALQTGNEVSYNELASTCGIDKKTVSHYIQILEKAFIIYRINPFSRNLRNELKKNRKIYFIDNGIRNSLIRNLNPPDLRSD
ncbi:MAG: ATP-binding protein, partial [Spirochaetes bacterium]|nr:ATP-binding protein [Spirochaetota bacterium]